MPTSSQLHWWRHYYTRGVEFDKTARTVTVHFEFPPSHFEEYNEIVPQLQIPWIEHEFQNHQAVFNKVGLGWTLIHRSSVMPHSTIEQMPDSVLFEMLKELRRRALIEHERRRQSVLQTFKEARPFVERKLEDLRSKKESLSAERYVEALMEVAESLWEIGSRRSAWTVVVFEYERSLEQLRLDRRVAIGSRLLEMLIEDDNVESAGGWISAVLKDCKTPSLNNADRLRCLRLGAKCSLLRCAYSEAVQTYKEAIAICTDESDKTSLAAELLEIHLLQGKFDDVAALEGGR